MAKNIVGGDLERIHSSVGRNPKWKDATIVVTGCAGFLGRYTMEYLGRYAAANGVRKVIGLDTFLLDRPAWLTKLASASPVVDVRDFDISKDDLGAVPGAKDATLIIHGASIASPVFYRRYPVETIDANIWGLRRILDFYRGSKNLAGLLFYSSSEIYGDPPKEEIPTSEDYRGNVACAGPRACYDESKRFGETICWIYANQFRMPITIARPFNNYGPGMRLGDQRLPADLAKCVTEGRDIVLLSDGAPTRTFCYVADAVSGYLLCLLHGSFDQFNIGIDKPEVEVRELARIFQRAGAQIWNYKGEVRYNKSEDAAYLVDNPNRRCPIIDKAKSALGYKPEVYVEEGVGRYLQFLKEEQA